MKHSTDTLLPIEQTWKQSLSIDIDSDAVAWEKSTKQKKYLVLLQKNEHWQ